MYAFDRFEEERLNAVRGILNPNPLQQDPLSQQPPNSGLTVHRCVMKAFHMNPIHNIIEWIPSDNCL